MRNNNKLIFAVKIAALYIGLFAILYAIFRIDISRGESRFYRQLGIIKQYYLMLILKTAIAVVICAFSFLYWKITKESEFIKKARFLAASGVVLLASVFVLLPVIIPIPIIVFFMSEMNKYILFAGVSLIGLGIGERYVGKRKIV